MPDPYWPGIVYLGWLIGSICGRRLVAIRRRTPGSHYSPNDIANGVPAVVSVPPTHESLIVTCVIVTNRRDSGSDEGLSFKRSACAEVRPTGPLPRVAVCAAIARVSSVGQLGNSPRIAWVIRATRSRSGWAFFFCSLKRRYLDQDTLTLVTATRPLSLSLHSVSLVIWVAGLTDRYWRLCVGATAEQCLVENQNNDRTNDGDEDAVEIQAGYPDVADGVEEPAAQNSADDS